MDTPKECIVCGAQLPTRRGSGRRRVYCDDRCRNKAYEQRKEISGSKNLAPVWSDRDQVVIDRWVEEGTRFDDIIDDPAVLGRFMDELLVRIGVYGLLEDHNYQRAVNQLVVAFFMIGRMGEGSYNLPIAADR
jgi:hypothetical protein